MSVQFRYVGPGGGGHGRDGEQAGVRMPGRYCLEPMAGGVRVVVQAHAHAARECANVRRGVDLIEIPDGLKHAGVPLERLFEAPSAVNGRVLYRRIGGP